MSTRTTTLRAHIVVTAVLLLLSLAAGAQVAFAQSLADVAKKEEERRRAVADKAKVYTNKDLNPAPAGSAAAKPADAKDDDKAAKNAKPKDDKDAKDDKDSKGDKDKNVPKNQAYWAGRHKVLQDALLRDQNYADAMQTRINTLTADFVNRDDPVQKSVIDQNRQKAVAELARLTKSIQGEKKAIADFMEEARLAGIPPGWLR